MSTPIKKGTATEIKTLARVYRALKSVIAETEGSVAAAGERVTIASKEIWAKEDAGFEGSEDQYAELEESLRRHTFFTDALKSYTSALGVWAGKIAEAALPMLDD